VLARWLDGTGDEIPSHNSQVSSRDLSTSLEVTASFLLFGFRHSGFKDRGASRGSQCYLQAGTREVFSRSSRFTNHKLSAYAKATADRSAFAATSVGRESAEVAAWE